MKLSQKTLENIALACIFAVPFVLLVTTSSTFFPMILGKNLAFRILVEIGFVAWFFVAIRDISFLPKRSPLFTVLAVFVGIMGLADILGVDIYRSIWSTYERMEGFMMLGHLFLYFIVATSILSRRELWDRFFYSLAGLSIFASLYGFLQAIGDVSIASQGDRIEAFLGNASYLAGFMLFCIFFSLSLFVRKRSYPYGREILASYAIGCVAYILLFLGLFIVDTVRMSFSSILLALISIGMIIFCVYAKRRNSVLYTRWMHYLLHGVLILMQIVTLVYSGTRGALLGLIAGFTFGAVFLTLKSVNRRLKFLAATIILMCMGVVAGIFALRHTELIQKNHALSRIAGFSIQEDMQTRFLVWGVAWQGVKERPFLGWGQGNFDVVFDKYYDAKLYSQEAWFDRAHNIIFDTLVTSGFIGLLAYVGILVFLLYSLWKNPQNSLTSIERAILVGLVVGYFVHSLFTFDNLATYLCFFSFLAFVVQSTGVEREGRLWNRLPLRSTLSSGRVQTVIAVLVVWMIWSVHVRSYLVGQNLVQAVAYATADNLPESFDMFQQALARRTPGSDYGRLALANYGAKFFYSDTLPEVEKTRAIQYSIDQLKLFIKENPYNARPPYSLGVFLANIGRTSEALEYLKQAQDISPNKGIITAQIGLTYIITGEYDTALEVLGNLLEKVPNYKTAALYYAAAAQNKGDSALAETTLIKSTGTNFSGEQIMLLAYARTGRMDMVVKSWELKISKDPNDINQRLHYAAALLKVKDKEKATRAINELVRLDPELKPVGDKVLTGLEAGIFSDILEPYRGY